MAEQSDAIEMILQDCLEKIQNGQSTLEEVLAEHPDLAEDLRPSLEAALWFRMHRATLDTRPGFIAASSRRVLEKIQQEQLAKTRPAPVMGENFFTRIWQVLTGPRQLVYQAALVFVLLFVMVAGSGGIAYAAQDALPGDLLYRVKISLENAEETFTQGEAPKAVLQIRLAQRRLTEIQSLIAHDRLGDIPKTITRFEDHINRAIHHVIAVRDLDQDRAAVLVASMQSVLQEQVGIFNQLASNASPTLRELIDRIELVSNGVISLASETLVDTGAPGIVVDATSTVQPTPTPLATQVLATSTIARPTAVPSATLPYYELLPTATLPVDTGLGPTPTPILVVTVVAEDDVEEKDKEDRDDKEDKDKDEIVKDRDKDLPDPIRRPIDPPGLNK